MELTGSYVELDFQMKICLAGIYTVRIQPNHFSACMKETLAVKAQTFPGQQNMGFPLETRGVLSETLLPGYSP